MNSVKVFQYLDYLKYIEDYSLSLPQKGRGFRKLMADQLGCQMSFITHVMSGQKDFSSEQLFKLAEIFHLNDEEKDYFMHLHAYNRAGTSELKKYYLAKLKLLKQEYSSLQNSFKETQELSIEDQAIYYSDWLYSAIQVAATVPDLQNITTLKNYFHLNHKALTKIVDFLSKKGFITFDGQKIGPGKTSIYFGNKSELVHQFHRNWRIKLADDLQNRRDIDFHYSLCFSAAEKDFPIIKETIVRAVEECMKIITPSKEEKLGVMCFDFKEL